MGDGSARMPYRQDVPARPAPGRPQRGRWSDAQAFAALDLGTNNCRLLIARPQGDGFAVIDAFARIVRLGEGLAANGRLSDAAIERTIAALRVCSDKLKRRNVTLARSVATEACRRADNGPEFIARAYAETGIHLDIISAEEEARLAGVPVGLIAVDMPLSLEPITGRRPSDNAIARAFGARHCSTHSPSVARPGALSDVMRAEFAAAGYPLRTSDAAAGGLIEVYPHPALVVLAGAARRLPYKAGNSAKYWPGEPIAVRRALLREQWDRIAALLATRIHGVADRLPPLPDPASGVERKAHEDMLDAIVCAWVGVTALTGQADAYGDAVSAIWVPREG